MRVYSGLRTSDLDVGHSDPGLCRDEWEWDSNGRDATVPVCLSPITCYCHNKMRLRCVIGSVSSCRLCDDHFVLRLQCAIV